MKSGQRDRHAQGQSPSRNLSGVSRPLPATKRGCSNKGRRHDAAKSGELCSKDRIGILLPSNTSTTRWKTLPSDELGLDVYPNQIEVITAEQMLDAYASTGMPLLTAIGRSASISRLMTRSTARVSWGWPMRSSSIPIHACPTSWRATRRQCRRWSSLMLHSVITISSRTTTCFGNGPMRTAFWTIWPSPKIMWPVRGTLWAGGRRAPARCRASRSCPTEFTVIRARNVPTFARRSGGSESGNSIRSKLTTTSGERFRARNAGRARRPTREHMRALLELPQENLLYFLEKTAPRLKPWQREILRLVRHIAQYFYPQRQTKVMNEGARLIAITRS